MASTGISKYPSDGKAPQQQQHHGAQDPEDDVENADEIANAISTFRDLDDASSSKTDSQDDSEEKPEVSEEEPSQREEDEEDADVDGEGGAGKTGVEASFAGTGSYKFDSADHVDEYLKNLGVGLVFRKVQSAANPTMTIFPCKPQEWAIKMDSIFRTREIKFHLGEEFTDETFDGRPCRSTATCESANRLVISQRCLTGPDVRVSYEVQPDNSIQMHLHSGPFKAILFFSSNSDI